MSALAPPTASISAMQSRVRALVHELYSLEPLLLQHRWDALFEQLEAERQRVREAGLWGLALPRELGGHGLSLADFALLAEEMGASPLGHYVFGCQAPEAGNIALLHAYGSPQQKAEVLEPLVSGKIRSCFAMTERQSSGANPTLMRTEAKRSGRGWRLSGEKWFTTAADGADYCIVMAVTDPKGPEHKRASLFLLPMSQPGLKVLRQVSVMGQEGRGPFSHSELAFEDCALPPESLIGGEGEAFRLAQARLAHGRIHHCARWLGIARRALDLLCERASSRYIGTERLLASSDLIQVWIAEAAAGLHAARLFVQQTAELIDQAGGRAARHDISMLKYFVSEILSRTLDRSLQAHGAAGVSDDFILAFFYREERAARIYDGPDEVHKLSVARGILKEAAWRRQGGEHGAAE